jgi:hypothetical protein
MSGCWEYGRLRAAGDDSPGQAWGAGREDGYGLGQPAPATTDARRRDVAGDLNQLAPSRRRSCANSMTRALGPRASRVPPRAKRAEPEAMIHAELSCSAREH